MKCDICGINDAVLFVQQVSANKTVELHLCFDCARKRGLHMPGKNAGDTLSNLISSLMQEGLNQSQNAACPVCGRTLNDLKKQKFAGCPECYTVFKSEIFSILKGEGMEGTYHGMLPKQLANFHSVLNDRMILQAKLADAVAVEDYEKAALYRDRLKALETRSVNYGDE